METDVCFGALRHILVRLTPLIRPSHARVGLDPGSVDVRFEDLPVEADVRIGTLPHLHILSVNTLTVEACMIATAGLGWSWVQWRYDSKIWMWRQMCVLAPLGCLLCRAHSLTTHW